MFNVFLWGLIPPNTNLNFFSTISKKYNIIFIVISDDVQCNVKQKLDFDDLKSISQQKNLLKVEQLLLLLIIVYITFFIVLYFITSLYKWKLLVEFFWFSYLIYIYIIIIFRVMERFLYINFSFYHKTILNTRNFCNVSKFSVQAIFQYT